MGWQSHFLLSVAFLKLFVLNKTEQTEVSVFCFLSVCLCSSNALNWAFAPISTLADLFLFCYERDFIMSLSVDKDAESIEAFNSKSRYLGDM